METRINASKSEQVLSISLTKKAFLLNCRYGNILADFAGSLFPIYGLSLRLAKSTPGCICSKQYWSYVQIKTPCKEPASACFAYRSGIGSCRRRLIGLA